MKRLMLSWQRPLTCAGTLLSSGLSSIKQLSCEQNPTVTTPPPPTPPPCTSSPAATPFRKRRLTIAASSLHPDKSRGIPTEEATTTGGSLHHPPDMKIMYAKELDDVIASPTSNPTTTPTDFNSLLPFSHDTVGIYSCHGIQPQPYHFILDPIADSSYDKFTKLTSMVTKKINQDRGCVARPYGGRDKMALFAVFDGHGQEGEVVSEFAMSEVQKRLYHHPKFDTDKVKAIRETFLEVEEALKKQVKPTYSGTTACIILLLDNHLYISNLGDSRAVLGTRTSTDPSLPFTSTDLTLDQKPDTPTEKIRLQNAGGYVTPPPGAGLSARVWLDRKCSKIGLAMSRSLGDLALKDVGVIADPVVSEYELRGGDEFLILATDGVWEYVSSSEAVDLVGEVLDLSGSADLACRGLIESSMGMWESFEGGYRDDITVIVVKLKGMWDDLEKEEEKKE